MRIQSSCSNFFGLIVSLRYGTLKIMAVSKAIRLAIVLIRQISDVLIPV